MRKAVAGVVGIICILGQTGFAQEASGMLARTGNTRILIVYFSHSGNTRTIAKDIHARVGGDVFEIKTVVPYTNDYDALVKQARRELDTDFRPKLQSTVDNMETYNVIFVGYPNWWGTYPMAVKALLARYDLSGKTLIPFCTHEGSRMGRSVDDLEKLCPDSKILEGLAIRGSSADDAQDTVSQWLRKIKMLKSEKGLP